MLTNIQSTPQQIQISATQIQYCESKKPSAPALPHLLQYQFLDVSERQDPASQTSARQRGGPLTDVSRLQVILWLLNENRRIFFLMAFGIGIQKYIQDHVRGIILPRQIYKYHHCTIGKPLL